MKRRHIIVGAFLIGTAVALELVSPAAGARLREIDGDTVYDLEARESLRLANVNTPELRGDCAAERTMAQRAKAFTGEAVRAKGVTVHHLGRRDKYGRPLVLVTVPRRGDLGELLIAAKLGVEYHGGPRKGWCP